MFEIRIGDKVHGVFSRLDDAIKRAQHMGPRAWVYLKREIRRELKYAEQILVKKDKSGHSALGVARGRHSEVLRHYVVVGVVAERVY